MKLVDTEETIVIVIAADLEEDHLDRASADRLVAAILERGGGHPYRRAVVVSDLAWFETPMFHGSPTITIGGPGVNGVAGRFAGELPTVWTEAERAMIQAEWQHGPRRAALWGMDRSATASAVDAFIGRGWLDEFLDRSWRYRAGSFA